MKSGAGKKLHAACHGYISRLRRCVYNCRCAGFGYNIDQAALLNQRGALCHIVSNPAPPVSHCQDCYESDALRYAEIAEAILAASCLNTDIKPPLGLCSQRSSFLIWEKDSGKPVTPLISWQDSRGKRFCDETGKAETLIPALTGLRLTPYYYAPKLSVLLCDNPQWREKLIQGAWLAGTLDTFLIWRWTHGQHFCTDASMAARTLLMDIHAQQWSEDLCRLFNIPRSILPQIIASNGFDLPLSNGFRLHASLGDQSAAFCTIITNDPSKVLVNLGTGGFVIRLLNAVARPLPGYLQTLIYLDKNRSVYLANEGTLNAIATALAPYPFTECDIADFAANKIFCLAEPNGLGAPYFNNSLGLHFSEPVENLTPQQIAVLLLEAIVFRVARILEDFHQQSPLTQIYLSGGLSELTCLQQGIAQCVPFSVVYLQQKETSLLGAAILAAAIDVETFCDEQTGLICADSKQSLLREKYQNWKKWLDSVLYTYSLFSSQYLVGKISNFERQRKVAVEK